jgi:Domain of unknown function (DUF4386)
MTAGEKFTLQPDYARAVAPYGEPRRSSPISFMKEEHMSSSFIARLGAAGAIAYGVMEIVGDSLSSTTDSTQTPQQIAAYFASNAPTTATWAGIYIEALGMFALLIFGAYLWSVGRDREGGRLLAVLALSGGVVQTAAMLAAEPPKIAIFYRAAQGIDPQIVATLQDMHNAFFFLGFMPQALLAAAAGGLAIRTGLFPAWLGWAGIVVAIAMLASIAASPDSNFHIQANVVFFLWLAVTGGVLLWRTPEIAPSYSKVPATV